MKERPILFSGEMVRAILDGRKTQTRRVVKVPLEEAQVRTACSYSALIRNCPHGQPGDRLWVRETWKTRREWDKISPGLLPCSEEDAFSDMELRERNITYAVKDTAAIKLRGRLRPSIFMPRWASRITLELNDVRVERLQEISGQDAIAEGIQPYTDGGITTFKDYLTDEMGRRAARQSYETLWESINGRGSWAVNPFVWVLGFKRA